MERNRLCFQSKRGLFREFVLPVAARSQEYAQIVQQFDMLLTLADRLLAGCEGNLEVGRICKIGERLEEISQRAGRERDRVVEDLLEDVELWLKTLVWLCKPSTWNYYKADSNREKHFTLLPTLRELDLLTQAELDLDVKEYQKITDPIRQAIFLAYRYRNPLTHSPEDQPEENRSRFLSAALVTLLASIHKHSSVIKDRLRGLVASPLPSDDTRGLLRLIESERQGHLAHFAAREQFLVDLCRRLDNGQYPIGEYLLLTGIEGIGKSALCAKLTEILNRDIVATGFWAGEVRKVAPWLPGVLLHFGKQSNHPGEIVHLLMVQANTMLLEPLPLPGPIDNITTEWVLEGEPSQVKEPVLSSARGAKARSQDDRYAISDQHASRRGDYALLPRQKRPVPELVEYRRNLYLVLEKVAQERGHLTLVLDAVDEISPNGTNLDFLPERLPEGVSAILTARHNAEVITWLVNNRQVERIRVPHLEEEEIPLLTRVDSSDGEAEAQFNARVWQCSNGWPVLIHAAASNARSCREDLTLVEIDRTADEVFKRQVREWEADDGTNSAEVRRSILQLLVVFEPVAPLDLELIQAHLAWQGACLTKADVRNLLFPVASQLEGLDVGQVKLGLKAFAEYVRDQYWSHADLRDCLRNIVNWLISEEEADVKVQGAFLRHWTDPTLVQDDRNRNIALQLLTALVNKQDAGRLYDVYSFSQENRSRGALLSFAETCLRAAADLGDVRAMGALGSRLLDGEGMSKDSEKGANWLQQAAIRDDPRSMVVLGIRLLDGNGLPKNVVEGEAWLRKAADMGDRDARGTLAVRLLDGHALKKNTAEGERLLHELVVEESEEAAVILAIRLLIGVNMEKDVVEAERLLRHLVDIRSDLGTFLLANMLLDGRMLTQNTEEGHQLLQTLASGGDTNAMIEMGVRLIDGRGLPKDPEQGMNWLKKAATAGRLRALRVLGTRLLTGEGISQNIREGEQFLIKAANRGSLRAMVELSKQYLDGKIVPRKPKEGERWLREAAEANNATAMGTLGLRLLDGKGLRRERREGEQWLRRAAEAGDTHYMLVLGERLFQGRELVQNAEQGEEWIRKAAEGGDTWAMAILSGYLLEGNIPPRESKEGEMWLRKAVSGGNTEAMRALGARLLYGRGLPKDEQEGIGWITQAANAREEWAMQMMGNLLLAGHILPRDPESGERWLRQAAEHGDPRIMLELGQRLIEGQILGRDVIEGERWLRKAAETRFPEAMQVLGFSLLFGDDLLQNVDEGKEWLRKAIKAGDGDAAGSLGRYYYTTGDYRAAAMTLVRGHELGSEWAGNNLAFMARRGEVPSGIDVPPVSKLLEKILARKEPYGLANYALCLAAGYECAADWRAADQVIASIGENPDGARALLVWWHNQLAKQGDPEGHLLTGWLVRHRFLDDPDNLTVSDRMSLARAGGWTVPEWMDSAS